MARGLYALERDAFVIAVISSIGKVVDREDLVNMRARLYVMKTGRKLSV